jgi:hypothetical protein
MKEKRERNYQEKEEEKKILRSKGTVKNKILKRGKKARKPMRCK